jgi:DNA-binding MarR family transcriptional regulator
VVNKIPCPSSTAPLITGKAICARPGDRRAVLIELTASGRRTAVTVQQAMTSLERRALAGLPPGAADGLRAGLEALAQVPA